LTQRPWAIPRQLNQANNPLENLDQTFDNTMAKNKLRCLLVEKNEGSTEYHLTTLPSDRFPEGEVDIRVAYSSLNYKDALACEGHPGVVRKLPHVPGIDAAGTVVASRSPHFKPGDEVLVSGYDFGQGRWGGWAEAASVPAKWLVPLPKNLSLRESMILGTAGFTAAQCVQALQRNDVLPTSGEVVVTGATGGVGSLAVQMLSQLGYQVVAVTGKPDQEAELLHLGACRVVERSALLDDSNRPMLSAKWAGGVDTVGGAMLTSLLRATQYGGCVAACGLVAGSQLEMTVYPFLLRGVSLCGIASADCPHEKRLAIWDLLAGAWRPIKMSEYVSEVTLQDLPDKVAQIKAGKIKGRVLVSIEATPQPGEES
jgi:acrylyl-CoA reductase (NADPH)